MLHQWDHAFHQSGYVGSSVLFHNGDAAHTLETLPMEARPEQCNEPTQPSLAPCWTCRQHKRSTSIQFEKTCVAWFEFGSNLKCGCLLQKPGLQLGSVIDVNHTAVRLINIHASTLGYVYGCLTEIDQESRCGDADNIYKHMHSTACRGSFCFASIEPSVNAFYYAN